MSHPLGFDTLLATLRARGVHVGVDETLRLEAVLARQSDADIATLRRIVTAVLAKSVAEQALIADAFATWVATAEFRVRPSEREQQPPLPANDSPPPPRIRWVRVAFAASAIAIVGLSMRPCGGPDTTPRDAGVVEDAGAAIPSYDGGLTPLDAGTVSTATKPPPRTIRSWRPTLRDASDDPGPWPDALPHAGLGLASAALAWWVWRQRNARRDPPTLERPHDEGPSEVLLGAGAAAQVNLLEVEEQDQVAWGVGRYLTGEPTRRLDVNLSVLETARAGGEPRLRFEARHRHHRVWTWLDVTTADPTAEQLATDLDLVLARAGLEHMLARYASLPDRLEDAELGTFSPRELDEGGTGALVLVFTDGRDLDYLLQAPPTRQEVRTLFRELSHWPRLAIVDFGDGRVRRQLEDFDLTILAPEQVPGYILAQERVAVHRDDDVDLAAWIGASALGFLPQDDATLVDVRRDLRLDVSAWHLSSLRAAAQSGERRHVEWALDQRIEALTWLLEAEDPQDDDSLLRRASAFWKRRLRAEADRRKSQIGWAGSVAESRLELAETWIDLFEAPVPAIERLFALFEGGHRGAIEPVARRMRPADHPEPGCLTLPWALSDLDDAQLAVWLDAMGFLPEGRLASRRLRAPGRVWVGVGLALGLASIALGSAAQRAFEGPTPVSPPPGARWTVEGDVLIASSPLVTERFPISDVVVSSPASPIPHPENLLWRSVELACTEVRADDTIVRCEPASAKTATAAMASTLTPPIATPDRRAVVIMHSKGGPIPQADAEWLVGAGYAHWFVFTPDWRKAVAALPRGHVDHLLVYAKDELTDADKTALAEAAADVAAWRPNGWVLRHGNPRVPSRPFVGVKSTPKDAGVVDAGDRRDGGASRDGGPKRRPVDRIRQGGAQRIDGGLRGGGPPDAGAHRDASTRNDCPPPRKIANGFLEMRCGTRPVVGWQLRAPPGKDPERRNIFLLAEAESSTRALTRIGSRLLDQGVADVVYLANSSKGPLNLAGWIRESSTPYDDVIGINVAEMEMKPNGHLDIQVRESPTRFATRLDLMGWYSLAELLQPGPKGAPAPIAAKDDELAKNVRLVGPATCPYQEVKSAHGVTWVYVCPGVFMMGSNDGTTDESPQHRVRISKGFWIGKYEISNAVARSLEPEVESRRDGDALPLTDVTWNGAQAICKKLGGRLPTEAEWEYAARGWTSRVYPWGPEQPSTTRAVFGRDWITGSPDPVATSTTGRGPFGAHHQAGNVWEWVADRYDEKAYENRRGLTVDPLVSGGPAAGRVLRGGSFGTPAGRLRSANRNWDPPGFANGYFGFRCVLGSRPQPAPKAP